MIRVEWIRQTRRIRTWACFAGLAAVPIIFSIASYVDPPRERRETNVFTLLTASGLNLAIVALFFMSQFFLVVVVAAFGGESVSGEATWGTLRYLLVRPVSRARLVLSKIFVAYMLAILSVLVIMTAGLVGGNRRVRLEGRSDHRPELAVPAARVRCPRRRCSFASCTGARMWP